jgi:hypothetical protein
MLPTLPKTQEIEAGGRKQVYSRLALRSMEETSSSQTSIFKSSGNAECKGTQEVTMRQLAGNHVREESFSSEHLLLPLFLKLSGSQAFCVSAFSF